VIERQSIESPAPHFIGQWQITEPCLSAAVIDYFESRRSEHHAGAMAGGRVDLAEKNSQDLLVRPNDVATAQPLRNYLSALFACYEDYLAQWSFLKSVVPRVHIGPFNIQKYEPGGHFTRLHSERTSLGSLQRVLAWMTYLNDVESEGETEFTHYGIKVQPRVGRTLIWPAEWTHAHRGLAVGAGEKYIVTGWMHFPDNDDADD
jgi:prolyl 4-hydroxylase